MVLIDPVIGAKIVFILGITNIIGLILVGLSCRCLLGSKPKLSSNRIYMKFFKYHCYYWEFFIVSVLIHSIVAILMYGVPV